MELTRRVETKEDVEITLDCEDVRELFAKAGYPIESGTPIQIITGGHEREFNQSANLGQAGTYLILRKRKISVPVYQENDEVSRGGNP